MMTGQHTDMTGVLDTEVDQYGSKLTPDDAEFWLYDVNLTTIAVMFKVAKLLFKIKMYICPYFLFDRFNYLLYKDIFFLSTKY